MNVLVLGSGGREDAILTFLAEKNPDIRLFALPGNAGMEDKAVLLPFCATDKDAVLAAAKANGIDFCIVTPDDPLAIGMVDHLEENGIACFGPDGKAARIESSKSFAKDLMRKYGIPTARYEVFTDKDEAKSYIRRTGLPIVIKADGLALGKGVVIPSSMEEADEALERMLSGQAFGESGKKVVIEEFLDGPEVSVLAFTDGRTIRPLVSSMDHKRAYDGDRGPNTGGMGTIAPNPFYTKELQSEAMEKIFVPTIRAMEKEGCPFRGCLYFGLMLTADGVKVIEYNARFGDPETQVVLPLLDGNLLEIMQATRNGCLDKVGFSFVDKAAACVILASGGYPGPYRKGMEISIGQNPADWIFFAGVKKENGRLSTAGGRVLGVVAVDDTIQSAVGRCYEAIGYISFEDMQFRHDIGARAIGGLNGI